MYIYVPSKVVTDLAGNTLILILIIEVKQRILSFSYNCVRMKSAAAWYLTGLPYRKLFSFPKNIQWSLLYFFLKVPTIQETNTYLNHNKQSVYATPSGSSAAICKFFFLDPYG